MSSKRKTIVVSAVSLRKGGTLTILQDCLCYLFCFAADGNYGLLHLYIKENWLTIRTLNILKCRTLSKGGDDVCGVNM